LVLEHGILQLDEIILHYSVHLFETRFKTIGSMPIGGEDMNQKTGTPQQPKMTFPNGAKLTAEQVHERFEGRVRSDPDSVDMPGFIATSSDLLQLLKYLKKGTRVK
jgi:hypothetical protein